jgi:hypothetical protein
MRGMGLNTWPITSFRHGAGIAFAIRLLRPDPLEHSYSSTGCLREKSHRAAQGSGRPQRSSTSRGLWQLRNARVYVSRRKSGLVTITTASVRGPPGKAVDHRKLRNQHLGENSHTQKRKDAGTKLSTVSNARTAQRTQEIRHFVIAR